MTVPSNSFWRNHGCGRQRIGSLPDENGAQRGRLFRTEIILAERIGIEYLGGDSLQLCAAEGVNLLEQDAKVFLLGMIKIGFCVVDGEVLTVVTCHGYLPFQLTLRYRQAGGRKGVLHQFFQFFCQQSLAALHVLVAAGEIGVP